MTEWEPFSKADGARLMLASYVTADAAELVRLEINRHDVMTHTGDRRQIVEAVYAALSASGINYELPPPHDDPWSQKIRTPAEILDSGDGTCIDLVAMFCGVCLGKHLRPYLVVFEGHALAAVWLRDDDDLEFRSDLAFPGGLLTNPEAIRRLFERDEFVLAECTGVAYSTSLSEGSLEGRGRTDGRLSFDGAVEAARRRVLGPGAQLVRYVVDVAAAREHGVAAKPFRARVRPDHRATLSAIEVRTPDGLGQRPTLIGRQDVLSRLRTRLERGEPVLVQGFPGIGKTAVARALVTGWVIEKDGPIALWITVGRAEPTAVFEAIARHFGVPEFMELPDAERETELRNRLRRVPRLIVLNDVWQEQTAASVLRILPDNCQLLITSRNRMPGLSTESLPRLDDEEGLAVLRHYADRDVDGDSATELVRLLGGHPMALLIAGRIIAINDVTPARLLAHIREAPHARLMLPGDPEEGRRNIQALIDTSLSMLDGVVRSVFFAFGAAFVPAATPSVITEYLAAQSAGADVNDATVADALVRLRRRGLAERGTGEDQFIIHDLAFSYAQARTGDDERIRMLDVLVGFVVRHAGPTAANTARLLPEVPHACAAARWGLRHDCHAQVVSLAGNLYFEKIMELYGMHEAAIDLQSCAVDAARQLGDRYDEAQALSDLAKAQARTGRLTDAERNFRASQAIRHELGDEGGEANEQGNLGALLVLGKRYTEAIDVLIANLPRRRAVLSTTGEGIDLGNLGVAYRNMGRLREAIDCYQQRIDIEAPNHYYALEGTYGNLGNAHFDLAQYDDALAAYTSALEMAVRAEFVVGQAHDQVLIGNVHKAKGGVVEAIRWHRQAVATAERQRDIGQILEARNALADAYIDLRQERGAVQELEIALRLTDQLEDPLPRIEQLVRLGAALVRVGRFDEAEQRLVEAQKLADQRADPLMQGHVWSQRAWVARNMPDRRAEAAEFTQRAIACAREADQALLASTWLGELGGLLAEDGAIEEALARIDEASDAAGEDVPAQAAVSAARGYALSRAERFTETEAAYREAARLIRGTANKWELPTYLGEAGNSLQAAGDLDGARSHFQQAVDAAATMRNVAAEAQWRTALAIVLAVQGRCRSAAAEFDRVDGLQPAAERDTLLDRWLSAAKVQQMLNRLPAAAGILERAERLVAGGTDSADPAGDPVACATVARAMADICFESADNAGVAAAMATLERLEPQLPVRQALRLVEGVRVFYDYHQGAVGMAISRQESLVADAESHGDHYDLGSDLGTLAMLHLVAGQADLAADIHRRIDRSANRMIPAVLVNTLLIDAAIRLGRDDRPGAASAVAEADALLREMEESTLHGDAAATAALLHLLDSDYRRAAQSAHRAATNSVPRMAPERRALCGLSWLMSGDRYRARLALDQAAESARPESITGSTWHGAAYSLGITLACQMVLNGPPTDGGTAVAVGAYRRALDLCDAPGLVADARQLIEVLARLPHATPLTTTVQTVLSH